MSIYYEQSIYKVEISGACLGETKKGMPQIEIGIDILGYYDAACGGMYRELSGPSRTVYLSVTENTMGTVAEPGWVWQTLTDLGFVGPSLADLAPLVGQVRDAQCKVEGYEGTPQEKWGIFRRRGSSAQRPVAAVKARQLDSQFSRLLKSAKTKIHETNGHAPKSGDGPTSAARSPAPAPTQPPQQVRKPAPAHGPNGSVVDAPYEGAGAALGSATHADIPF